MGYPHCLDHLCKQLTGEYVSSLNMDVPEFETEGRELIGPRSPLLDHFTFIIFYDYFGKKL